jgi:hypothetical protein
LELKWRPEGEAASSDDEPPKKEENEDKEAND